MTFPLKGRTQAALLLSIWFASYRAPAQGTQGAISGRVTDVTGAVDPNAQVTITNEGTNVKIPLKTNDAREYTYSALIEGRYSVTVTAPGFATYTRQHVQVDVDSHVVVDVALTVGQSSETMTVSANTQELSYDSANLGMTIEEKSITDLPLIYGTPLLFIAWQYS